MIIIKISGAISIDCPNVINLAIGLHMTTKQSSKMNAIQTDCCSASSGVTCSTSSSSIRVIQIAWNGLTLDGTINGSAIPPNLQYLNLCTNYISGTIPILPSTLTKLDLNNNMLTSPVPPLPPSCLYIDISSNYLTGSVSVNNTAALTNLMINNNEISSVAVAVKTGLTASNCLLHNNPLNSNTQTTLSTCKITTIYASDCEILFKMVFLISMGTFSSNTLLTTLRNSNCCSQNGMTCSNGKITSFNYPSVGLAGQLDPIIIQLTSLTGLRASGNKLYGTIPPLPPAMTILDLSSNLFTGAFPILNYNLTLLNFSYNSLSGTIPMLSHALTSLSLTGNLLNGSLPTLPTLPSRLTILQIARNKISGDLNFTGLITVDASYNLLSSVSGNCNAIINCDLRNNPKLSNITSACSKKCLIDASVFVIQTYISTSVGIVSTTTQTTTVSSSISSSTSSSISSTSTSSFTLPSSIPTFQTSTLDSMPTSSTFVDSVSTTLSSTASSIAFPDSSINTLYATTAIDDEDITTSKPPLTFENTSENQSTPGTDMTILVTSIIESTISILTSTAYNSLLVMTSPAANTTISTESESLETAFDTYLETVDSLDIQVISTDTATDISSNVQRLKEETTYLNAWWHPPFTRTWEYNTFDGTTEILVLSSTEYDEEWTTQYRIGNAGTSTTDVSILESNSVDSISTETSATSTTVNDSTSEETSAISTTLDDTAMDISSSITTFYAIKSTLNNWFQLYMTTITDFGDFTSFSKYSTAFSDTSYQTTASMSILNTAKLGTLKTINTSKPTITDTAESMQSQITTQNEVGKQELLIVVLDGKQSELSRNKY